jgi:hypothetical protein
MSRVIKIAVRNIIEFEVDDDFEMTNYDSENFLALAKKAIMLTPQSELMNGARYKIKGGNNE